MARAISIEKAFMSGVRVAGTLTYIPAGPDGKNARCMIPVYSNSNRGTNQDGSPGRSDQYTIIAWGKLADVCAVSCSPGKALDIVARPGSYIGTVYNSGGSPVLNMQGQVVTTRKVSFTIENIVFGEESAKTVANDIASGIRGANWQNPQHPDYQNWIAKLRARQAMKYQPGMTAFGYARVRMPKAATNAGFQPQPQQQQFNAGFQAPAQQQFNAGSGHQVAGFAGQPGGFQAPPQSNTGYQGPVNQGYTGPAAGSPLF